MTGGGERRFTRIGKLRVHKVGDYIALHANVPQPVRAALRNAGVRDLRIDLDAHTQLVFSSFVYIGRDREDDFSKLEEDRSYREWSQVTGACFEDVEGAIWRILEPVCQLSDDDTLETSTRP